MPYLICGLPKRQKRNKFPVAYPLSDCALKTLENDPHGASLLLDAEGLLCPEPVMMLHKKVRVAVPGAVIKVVATDASTERDIPRFCEFLRHSLLAQSCANGFYCYWIRVRGG